MLRLQKKELSSMNFEHQQQQQQLAINVLHEST